MARSLLQNVRLSSGAILPSWVRREHEARFEFAARYVAGKVVVDCACGSGAGTKVFAMAGAAVVHAVDLDLAGLDEARTQCRGHAVNLLAASATRLPLRPRIADVFISLETIEHLDDAEAFLAQVRRALKPEGTFICSTPNRKVTNPGLRPDGKPCNRFHVREYSAEEFSELLGGVFEKCELWGQNAQCRLPTRALGLLGRCLPWHGATRAHQFCKLLRAMTMRRNWHAVQARDPGREYEYLVAVCARPRANGAD